MNFNLKNGLGDTSWGHINVEEVEDIRIFTHESINEVSIVVELKNGTEIRIGSYGEKKVMEWDRPTQTATHHKLTSALVEKLVVKEFTNTLTEVETV